MKNSNEILYVKNLAAGQDKSAGRFSSWLQETNKSLQGRAEANVPCGECSACCSSSYFIHIKPSDSQAIVHIPKELTFPAPGLPKGHLLLGYDDKGRCPMFVEGECSIYEFRSTNIAPRLAVSTIAEYFQLPVLK